VLGAAQPNQSAKNSGHFPINGARGLNLHPFLAPSAGKGLGLLTSPFLMGPWPEFRTLFEPPDLICVFRVVVASFAGTPRGQSRSHR